jgi:hypothetical protein
MATRMLKVLVSEPMEIIYIEQGDAKMYCVAFEASDLTSSENASMVYEGSMDNTYISLVHSMHIPEDAEYVCMLSPSGLRTLDILEEDWHVSN